MQLSLVFFSENGTDLPFDIDSRSYDRSFGLEGSFLSDTGGVSGGHEQLVKN